ncbi:hypothetical protein [Rubritalea marina]|uniref:hypothetical protein n=1 Tax=Rubritalea marina TaxID=361055 RepID=UPI0003690B3C|nr:hypothetical protein [Rubritalea marina]
MKNHKPLRIIALALIFCAALAVILYSRSEESWNRERIIQSVAAENRSGSGYRELEGKFIEYSYIDFGSFQLAIYDNQIKWRGKGGYFDGIVASVEPQISKVDDGIYFLSWVFGDHGGDNVVVNFKDNTVYAHLRSGQSNDDSEAPDFEMIHGNVQCGPSANGPFPEGEPISMLRMILKLTKNTKKQNLPPMFTTPRPVTQAELIAREELAKRPICYESVEGNRNLKVLGGNTIVSDNAGSEQSHRSYATKVADGIYFISWLGNPAFGNHIVFNAKTNKIYEHVIHQGLRNEWIHDASTTPAK